MARTQQENKYSKPVVTPKPVDLSKVDFANASLFDLALLARIEALERSITPVSQKEESKPEVTA